MNLMEFVTEVEESGVDPNEARLAVLDDRENWVWINLVDVEQGDVSFIRFFRDDDIPATFGAPGCNVPAENAEGAAPASEAETHATMRCRYPWQYDCRMSFPGARCWHGVEIDHFDEEDGYDIVVLRDTGEVIDEMPWSRLY